MVLEVNNPYSGELLCKLPKDGGVELQQKLEKVADAYGHWRLLDLPARRQQVALGLAYFSQHSEEIAREISQQMGKPITQARHEVKIMCARGEHMLEIAEAALAPQVLPQKDGVHRRIQHEPLGMVLNIAAWNFPLLLAVNVVVPALLAGNVVLLKHSAKTPLCGLHFERAFGRLQPAGLVANLILDHQETSQLIQDPRLRHVAFTGSVAGGRQVFQQVAQAGHHFMDTGLELGGKDPAYLAEDVNLEAAVAAVVDGACYNAGQSCCAIERVYVHQKHYQEFLERAKVQMGRYQLGDPMDENTSMGPLASATAPAFLAQQVQEAQAKGARLLLGGEPAAHGAFAPTLLADCTQDSQVMQDESFGPLLPVQQVASDAEALQKMNDSRYGLTACVWTRDRQRAEYFAQQLQTGTVFQNRCDYLDPGLSWTGVKDSGKGSTLSTYGFWHLTQRKSIHFKDEV